MNDTVVLAKRVPDVLIVYYQLVMLIVIDGHGVFFYGQTFNANAISSV